MDVNHMQSYFVDLFNDVTVQLQRLPGSSIVLRYVKSSYQNDPIRSAIELFLFLFAVRYLLAPTYSVQRQKGYVDFTEDVGSPDHAVLCKR